MQAPDSAQIEMLIGVDVGGTFTDLLAWDGSSLRVVKVPSTPPDFERAVIDATKRVLSNHASARMVHGSTVATNALLQRAGEQVAFVTTEGFRDMLLIGRQNRPSLYALHVKRPPPITQHYFTVRERIDAHGQVVEPLQASEIDELIRQISSLKLKHVAVCLLFSFVNPIHEQMIAERCAEAGMTVSLSSEVLPEFREYERACTTAINASLRPTVATYLDSLDSGLPRQVRDLQIMQSGGGTLDASEAARKACKLVLSGPAGGVIGAAYVARKLGFNDVITYDMGGTSTDVALVLDGRPQWTTASTVDGLPIGLPMFDIHTVGAGGGSIARVDAGGALRVGPQSAGAIPGPACYARGGTEATVTDANVVLERVLPEHFLGGAMKLDVDLARAVVSRIAQQIGKDLHQTSLGILKVAEANMAHAIRAVSSRRGFDPRRFALVSFGGAGGLHACALAEGLDMSRVVVPPYCGVLSALGMIVAPPISDASRTVVQLGSSLDDARLAAEFDALSELTVRQISHNQTESVESWADVRFRGQSHELKVAVDRPTRAAIEASFLAEYQRVYGRAPEGRAIEIVTLRLRRLGRTTELKLPDASTSPGRAALGNHEPRTGPMLIVDPEATTFVPPNWTVALAQFGALILERQR